MRMAKFKTQHELKRILSMILAMCFVIVTVITDTSMTAKAADNTWSFSYTGGIHVYISATICCLAWYQEGKVIEYQKYRIAKDTHDLLLVDANSPQNKCKFDEGYCPSR